jgi:flagellar hook-associated protein 3 FlgL
MPNQIFTSSAHNNRMNIDNMQKLQKNIANFAAQGASGQKAVDYLGISKIIPLESSIDLAEKLKQTSSSLINNDEILRRLRQMDNALDGLIEIATSMQADMASRSSPIGSSMQLSETIKNQYFPAIADNLNTNFQGRYLFAGSKTNVRPVANLENHTNVINNSITANYYQGNGDILTAKVSDNLNLAYGINADNAAFRNIIAGANKMLSSDVSGNQKEMAATSTLIKTSLDQLIALRASINNNSKVIEDVQDSLETKKFYLEKEFIEINAVDHPTLSIAMAQEKLTLFSSFKMTTMLSEMSLINFLT